MPVPSIMSGPVGAGAAGRATPGVPALVIRAMRLRSMTTFMGPAGGAPVPSITMTLRIVRVGNGPCPSPLRRSGAGTSWFC